MMITVLRIAGAVLLAVLALFLMIAYLRADFRQDLTVLLGQYWGWVAIVNSVAGLLFAWVIIWMYEESKSVAMTVLVLTIPFGNLVVLAWALLRLPHLYERLSHARVLDAGRPLEWWQQPRGRRDQRS